MDGEGFKMIIKIIILTPSPSILSLLVVKWKTCIVKRFK